MKTTDRIKIATGRQILSLSVKMMNAEKDSLTGPNIDELERFIKLTGPQMVEARIAAAKTGVKTRGYLI